MSNPFTAYEDPLIGMHCDKGRVVARLTDTLWLAVDGEGRHRAVDVTTTSFVRDRKPLYRMDGDRRRTDDESVESEVAITAESAREIQVENVAAAMLRWMRKHPDKAPTANGLRKSSVANADRALVPEAIELLTGNGSITEAEASRVGTQTYRLT